MKTFRLPRPLFLLAFLAAAALALPPSGQAQAEKIKEKAKDLKKQVEGTAPKTNAPPVRPPAPAK